MRFQNSSRRNRSRRRIRGCSYVPEHSYTFARLFPAFLDDIVRLIPYLSPTSCSRISSIVTMPSCRRNSSSTTAMMRVSAAQPLERVVQLHRLVMKNRLEQKRADVRGAVFIHILQEMVCRQDADDVVRRYPHRPVVREKCCPARCRARIGRGNRRYRTRPSPCAASVICPTVDVVVEFQRGLRSVPSCLRRSQPSSSTVSRICWNSSSVMVGCLFFPPLRPEPDTQAHESLHQPQHGLHDESS